MTLAVSVTGEGPDLVLLHGAGLDQRMWDPALPYLADRARVVRYDLRGHGRSPSPAFRFSDVDDLDQVLDSLNLDRAVLVGHSLGGAIAVDYTLSHPDHVRGLVLVATNLSGHPWALEGTLAASADARRGGDLDAFIELELQTWAPLGRTPEIARLVREGARRRFHEDEQPDFFTPPPDADERLGNIAVPTLVLTPKDDHPQILAIASRITEAVPRARQHVLAGDHFLPMRKPEQFAELVLEHSAG